VDFIAQKGKGIAVDHRAAVGPADKYDVLGFMQLNILVREGLREQHRVLDIGCGSLRGGRFLLLYLAPGCYYGLEKDETLVQAGITQEVSAGLITLKRPTFKYVADFDLRFGGIKFDYILAQSILSHASQTQVRKIMTEVAQVLAPRGRFLFTYFQGPVDYSGAGWAQAPDAHYTERWMAAAANAAGLTYEHLYYKHPSNQTWARATHE